MKAKLVEHLVARHGYKRSAIRKRLAELIEAHRWMHRRVWLDHHHGEPAGGRDPPGWETGEGVAVRVWT